MVGINSGGSKIILDVAGINFGGSQKKLFLAGTDFGGFFTNPPEIVSTITGSLKVLNYNLAATFRCFPIYEVISSIYFLILYLVC